MTSGLEMKKACSYFGAS